MAISSPSAIPEVLEALQADLAATERLLEELDEEIDVTHRAELTMELVRTTSLVEDTMERGVFDFLDERLPAVAEHGRAEATRLRAAMVPVDQRTRHVAAMDVHRSDPDGFEDELATFEATLADVRSWELTELYPVLDALRSDDQAIVHERVEAARRHASEHPAPAGPIGRMIHKIGAKMDHHPDIADRKT